MRWRPVIPWQTAVSVDPSQKTFDDPAARKHGEPELIRQLAHGFHDDACRVRDAFSGIGGIGEDMFDEGEGTNQARLEARAQRRRGPAPRPNALAAQALSHLWRPWRDAS